MSFVTNLSRRRFANRPWIRLLSAGLLLIVVFLAPVSAQGDSEKSRTIFVPEGWEGAYEFGYAPVVRIGDKVIVSGIPAGGEGSYEEKIRRMYTRAKQLLEAAGATIEDVVELSSYHVGATDSAKFGQEFSRYIKVHREFFGDHRPAWTAVGTPALLDPSAPVEVRFVAYVGSGQGSRVVRGAGDGP